MAMTAWLANVRNTAFVGERAGREPNEAIRYRLGAAALIGIISDRAVAGRQEARPPLANSGGAFVASGMSTIRRSSMAEAVHCIRG